MNDALHELLGRSNRRACFGARGSFRFTMYRSDAMAPKTHACCRDRSSGQCSIRPIFVGKPIPKLDRFLSRDRHSYFPNPEVASIEEFLAVVQKDEHGCFFG